jgi:hypothetical protein
MRVLTLRSNKQVWRFRSTVEVRTQAIDVLLVFPGCADLPNSNLGKTICEAGLIHLVSLFDIPYNMLSLPRQRHGRNRAPSDAEARTASSTRLRTTPSQARHARGRHARTWIPRQLLAVNDRTSL